MGRFWKSTQISANFFHPVPVPVLLFYRQRARLIKQALLSLDKMIKGGIYDQLGGGFSRYSTDEKWLAPHFEKMLYDNALLLTTISEAYQLTADRCMPIPSGKHCVYKTRNDARRKVVFTAPSMPIAKAWKENIIPGAKKRLMTFWGMKTVTCFATFTM